MRTIRYIQHIKEWVKDGKQHYRTYAILDTGEEVQGYGNNFRVGDKVMYYFNDKYNVAEMRRDERKTT